MTKLGETQDMCAEGAFRNSQAKGPASDDTLESSNGAAPKKQPVSPGIFQVKHDRAQDNNLSCAFLCEKGGIFYGKDHPTL